MNMLAKSNAAPTPSEHSLSGRSLKAPSAVIIVVLAAGLLSSLPVRGQTTATTYAEWADETAAEIEAGASSEVAAVPKASRASSKRLQRHAGAAARMPSVEEAPALGRTVSVTLKRVQAAGLVTPELPQRKQGTITGTVTSDATGDPLPGVNVTVEGTQQGAATDPNGQYTITGVKEGTYTVAASFIGYGDETKEGIEVQEGETTVVDFALQEQTETLDEVVVTGYGTETSDDLTGSVSSVTPEEIDDQPVTRVGEALQGRAPGAQVRRISGAPGGGVTIRIRGANSLRGGNGPLYVIDGYVGGSISSINPDDIASIDILKDASATALYGSRGANGVVVIETKQGEAGKPQVSFNSYLGTQRVANKIDLLNAGEYAEVINKRKQAVGQDPVFSEEQVAEFRSQGGTDWQDEIFRPGLKQNYSLSVQGGSSDARYHISGNHSREKGILINSNSQRYGLKSNISTDVTDYLDLSLDLRGSREVRHNADNLGPFIQGPVLSALVWGPTRSVYDESGAYTYGWPYGPRRAFQNPVFLAQERYVDATFNNLLTSGNANFQILDDLSLAVNGSVRYRSVERNRFNRRRPEISIGAAIVGTNQNSLTSLQHSERLTYDSQLNENHKLKVTAVFEQQYSRRDGRGAGGRGLPTLALGYYGLNTVPEPNANATTATWSIMSGLGRVNYVLFGRYLFTGTIRRDGTSRFTPGNRWGTFPSGAIGWRVHQEDFLKNVNWIDRLKLRGSYGVTGSQAIGAYTTLPSLALGQDMTWDSESLTTGIGPTRPANPDLGWERTSQLDVGVDFSVLDRRLSLTADYYRKYTEDLLLNRSVPNYLGFGSLQVNQGKVSNQGVEASLTAVPLQGENFEWEATVNFTSNRTKVVELGDPSNDEQYIFTGNYLRGQGLAPMFVIREGEPLGQFYGLIYEGVWQKNEAEEAARYGQKPGDARYRDLNDNGVYDDLTNIGNGYPDFTWGLSSSLNYKRFTLDFLVRGVQGKQVFNPVNYFMVGGGPGVRVGPSRRVLDRWSPENTDTEIPAFSTTSTLQAQSSFSVEDGSYIRLRNITLGYRLPTSLLGIEGVTNIRLYVSGQDLLTITDFKGYDPAINSSGGNDLTQGVNMGAYPNPRSFTFGVNATF